jgi:hypothetical protein
MVLCWVGAAVLGAFGCQSQPNIKPEEKPQLLAMPDARDKRYSEDPNYPADELASELSKKNQNQMGAVAPVRGPKTPGMGMGAGPGGGNY